MLRYKYRKDLEHWQVNTSFIEFTGLSGEPVKDMQPKVP